MKTSKILISTFVAAAAMSVPALADDVSLTDGQNVNIGTAGTGAGSTYIVPTGTTFESDSGSWIHWCSGDSDTDAASTDGMSLGTADASVSLSGSGFLGLAYHGGNGGVTYTVNLQNTDATSFSGQLTVVNSWYSPTNVILSGDSWANTEYVSAWVSRESGKNWLWSRGNGSNAANMENDTLTLAGNTTLAGIRGAAQGVSSGSVADANAREFLVAQSSGTTLTLDGAGTYAFYGTVGAADNRLSITKTGTGTQTLGGTSYLGSVSVSAGTLTLDGTVNLSSAITVSGNGSVTVADTVVFDLGNLAAGEGNVYTLVSGADSVTGWSSLNYTNFTINEALLTSRSRVDVSTAGSVAISVVDAANLVWTGNGSSWDHDTAENWSGADDSKFYDGDNVSFGADTESKVVTVSESLRAGTVSVADGYTFTASSDVTLAASGIVVASGGKFGVSANGNATLTISGAVTAENGGKTAVVKTGEGTVSLSNGGNRFSSLDVQEGRLEVGSGSANMISSIKVGSGATLAIVSGNDLATWGGTTYDIAGTLDTGTCRLSISGGSFTLRDGAVISGTGDSHGALDFYGNTTVNVVGDAEISAVMRMRTWTDSSSTVDFNVDETKTLTFSGVMTESAELKKSGAGTMTLSGNSSAYTGTVRVSGGVLKLAGSQNVLGEQDQDGTGTRYAAVVESGGTLDINGNTEGGNNCYKIELAGGSLINTGANVGTGQRQITGLRLTADSVVGGSGNFGVIASSYAATTVDLGGYTLTKTGSNSFWLYNTTLSGGTVDIQGGVVSVLGSLTMTDSMFRLNGGKLQAESAGLALGDVEIVLSDATSAEITIYGTNSSFVINDDANLYLDISGLELALSDVEQITLNIATANAISGDNFFSMVLVGTRDESGAWIDSTDWSYVSGSWNAATGKLSLVSIPEPSAFGLIAGVGALALVAARRRRQKKA